MIKSLLVILSGNAAASALLLARNLLIARMIPVADYGIAATFAMMMAVVEMASTFGLQQQIIQARNGDDPRFQAALQGFQLLRGCLAGLAMVVLAGPVAAFMGIPGVAWAYQLLALVPVLNALVHFDIHRLTRRMVFGPVLLSGALPALASVLAVWPLVHVFGDWRVMLWAILVQAALTALASHLLAERPWRLAFDRAVYAGSLRFGWPLLANAILLFLVFHGDKLIVGRLLGMQELAIFAMGVTLTLTPINVVSKSLQNHLLPRLSRAQDAAAFHRLAWFATEAHVLVGGALIIATGLAGPAAIALVLGPGYAPLAPLLVWLAALQALRIVKGGPSLVALARGQTENALIANLVRVALLPLGAWMVAQGGGVMMLIHVAMAGELIGALVALGLQRGRQGVPLAPLLPVLAATTAAGLTMLAWPQSLPGTALAMALLGGGAGLSRLGQARRGRPLAPPPKG